MRKSEQQRQESHAVPSTTRPISLIRQAWRAYSHQNHRRQFPSSINGPFPLPYARPLSICTQNIQSIVSMRLPESSTPSLVEDLPRKPLNLPLPMAPSPPAPRAASHFGHRFPTRVN